MKIGLTCWEFHTDRGMSTRIHDDTQIINYENQCFEEEGPSNEKMDQNKKKNAQPAKVEKKPINHVPTSRQNSCTQIKRKITTSLHSLTVNLRQILWTRIRITLQLQIRSVLQSSRYLKIKPVSSLPKIQHRILVN